MAPNEDTIGLERHSGFRIDRALQGPCKCSLFVQTCSVGERRAHKVAGAMQGAFEFYGDLPKRPARPERLFFGLFPDTETALRVGRLRQRFLCENRLAGTPLKTERLHVSLHHVDDYKRLRSKFIYAAKQAGKAVSLHPFEATFRFIKSFEGAPSSSGRPRRRPLVLVGEGNALFKLHKILGAAMEGNGLRATEHFTPHMTLSYGPKAVSVQAIEPIRFVVNEFALIHSELGLTRYNILDRWPLQGNPATANPTSVPIASRR